MKTATLAIDLIRTDGDTQSRVRLCEEVVSDYAEIIAEANGEWVMGDLDVFHDGNEYWLADGFHRTMAAIRVKRASIPCRIHNGTKTDARMFSMTANDRHGLRMSRGDKRACVEWLLDNHPNETQTEIAALAGVSRRMVQIVEAERKAQIALLEGEPSEDGDNSGGETEPKADVHDDPEPVDVVAETRAAVGHIAKSTGDFIRLIAQHRDKYPGKPAETALEAAKDLFDALKAWQRKIK